MIIFHGSKYNFKEFDFDKIRTNGTTEGVGFYCTDNKEIASRYAGEDGYVISYKYVGKKQLNSEEITLSGDELRKYLLALNEDSNYLDNYGDITWSGVDEVLNSAIRSILEYDKDDIEIISGICNSYGDFERPLKILYDVLGYDSSIVNATWGNQKIYLILNMNAIEYIGFEKQ